MFCKGTNKQTNKPINKNKNKNKVNVSYVLLGKQIKGAIKQKETKGNKKEKAYNNL